MATGTDSSKPFSYELEVLTLVNNEGEGYDIRNLMMELKLHESVKSNFLLGEIAINDATGFLENAKIFGQESLRLRFKQPTGLGDKTHEDDVIDQIFRIYQVSGIQRIGQNTTVYRLRFCSPEFLHSKRVRISQAFRGSMVDIAGKLARDHLGIAVDPSLALSYPKLTPHFDVMEKSQGDEYHIVVPNWTVNYAINWLCSQAQGISSQSGLQDSFFFFQSANGGYRIQSLKGMMGTEYLQGGVFAYTPAETADGKTILWDETDGATGVGRRIMGYNIGSAANILEGVIEGLFASKQITIDNTYKYQTEKSYNYLEKFYGGKDMAMNDYPMVRQTDETLFIGKSALAGQDVVVSPYINYKNIGQYPDAHTILTSDSHFVNDKNNNIHQASHNTHLGSIQYRTAVKQLLKYYTMNLLLPTRTDISVGKIINLKIPQAIAGGDAHDPKFHSGRHLITDISWDLSQQECKTNIKVIKDSVINQIETTVASYADRIDEE